MMASGELSIDAEHIRNEFNSIFGKEEHG